jgi:hypothetical protein
MRIVVWGIKYACIDPNAAKRSTEAHAEVRNQIIEENDSSAMEFKTSSSSPLSRRFARSADLS